MEKITTVIASSSPKLSPIFLESKRRKAKPRIFNVENPKTNAHKTLNILALVSAKKSEVWKNSNRNNRAALRHKNFGRLIRARMAASAVLGERSMRELSDRHSTPQLYDLIVFPPRNQRGFTLCDENFTATA